MSKSRACDSWASESLLSLHGLWPEAWKTKAHASMELELEQRITGRLWTGWHPPLLIPEAVKGVLISKIVSENAYVRPTPAVSQHDDDDDET